MSDKLQQIQKSISEIQVRISGLQEEVKAVTIILTKKYAEQESAILAGKKTAVIDSEISGLRVKIAGTHSTIETLSSNLETLREEEEKEKIVIAKAGLEDAYAQFVTQAQEVYRLLSSVVDGIDGLIEKILTVRQFARRAKVANPSRMNSLLDMLSKSKAQIIRTIYDLAEFKPK